MPITAMFVPGANLANTNITLPTGFADIVALAGATLIRATSLMTGTMANATIAAAIANHAAADVVASLADHATADVAAALADHATADVAAALADHAAHGHNITTVAAAGGGAALTEPAVAGPLETAAAGQTNVGAVDVLAAAQAHAAGATPVAHAAGATPVAHAAGAAAVAHAAAAGGPAAVTFTGTDPTITITAANMTLVDRRTFKLTAQATALGDILILSYVEAGSVPRVA